jgi:hypothetical protein
MKKLNEKAKLTPADYEAVRALQSRVYAIGAEIVCLSRRLENCGSEHASVVQRLLLESLLGAQAVEGSLIDTCVALDGILSGAGFDLNAEIKDVPVGYFLTLGEMTESGEGEHIWVRFGQAEEEPQAKKAKQRANRRKGVDSAVEAASRVSLAKMSPEQLSGEIEQVFTRAGKQAAEALARLPRSRN